MRCLLVFGVLTLSALVKPITSRYLYNDGVAKRAVCSSDQTETNSGCPYWTQYCTDVSSIYYNYVINTCPVTCGVCEAPPTPPTPPPVPEVIQVDLQDCLGAHNEKRNLHINTSALTWDVGLANGSQDWSFRLANESSDPVFLFHSSGNYGENIAYSGTTGSTQFTCRNAVNSWYNEIAFYDWSYGNSTVPNEPIGHFTQVVWKASTLVGCGAAKITRGDWVYTFITCQYSPAGNFIGQYTNNVMPLM